MLFQKTQKAVGWSCPRLNISRSFQDNHSPLSPIWRHGLKVCIALKGEKEKYVYHGFRGILLILESWSNFKVLLRSYVFLRRRLFQNSSSYVLCKHYFTQTWNPLTQIAAVLGKFKFFCTYVQKDRFSRSPRYAGEMLEQKLFAITPTNSRLSKINMRWFLLLVQLFSWVE